MTEAQIQQRLTKLKDLYHSLQDDIPIDFTVEFPSRFGEFNVHQRKVIHDILEAPAIAMKGFTQPQVWAKYYNNIYTELIKLESDVKRNKN